MIKFGDVIIYHSGDTDIIPEMQKLTGYKQQGKEFIALLPVGGRFTMSAEEAAQAASIIKPTLAIPMHFGSIVGDETDAKNFVELCKDNDIRADLLTPPITIISPILQMISWTSKLDSLFP